MRCHWEELEGFVMQPDGLMFSWHEPFFVSFYETYTLCIRELQLLDMTHKIYMLDVFGH
jgi:hypothetical protein